MATNASSQVSSTAISVKLSVDGKNWKDWNKQLLNYASSDGALLILKGSNCPTFDPLSDAYKVETYKLTDPKVLEDTATETQKKTEYDRVSRVNALLKYHNDEARIRKREDEQAYEHWVSRDARFQNSILSIHESIKPQVRHKATAAVMYNVLKDLNGNTIHANGAIAWHDFVTLRADNCKTIRAYVGKFREALIDLNSQGISFKWTNPDSQTSTMNAVDELIVIHFLQGLEAVMPDWVEARNNKLRRDAATRWTLDALIASLEDHIRHTNGEPVNTFLTLAKKEEEARVLARLKSQNKPIPAAQPASGSATTAAKATTPKKSKQSVAHCNYCDRSHAGPNEACWYAHPELRPRIGRIGDPRALRK
ncbi:hypothetical protein EJ07DRAFT_142416 [Lizonia empirigonia]|nr:hypothetical protein EJ07DRAFT_142416 [Lizonia empirigonia]